MNHLFQSNGADHFVINNKNLFQEESQSSVPDVPPALPPKTGTPTRPPPPPPGQPSTVLPVTWTVPRPAVFHSEVQGCLKCVLCNLCPGKKSSMSRTESSDSFQRRGHFLPQSSGDLSSSSSSTSLPAKDPLADPFAPSSPPLHNIRESDRFASFDKVSTSLSPSPSPSSPSDSEWTPHSPLVSPGI